MFSPSDYLAITGQNQQHIPFPAIDHARITNTGVTQKPDHPFKEIRNPICQKLDNPIKGIHNIAPNRIQIQGPRVLTAPTYIDIKISDQPLIATCQWHLSNLLLPIQQIIRVVSRDETAVNPTSSTRKIDGGNKQPLGSPCGIHETHTS